MEQILNSPSIYIVGGAILLSIVYYIVVVPKIKAKAQNMATNLKKSFEGREEQIRISYLAGILQPIADAVGNYNILGIVECMEKKTTVEAVTATAINTAGKVLEEITGLEVTSEGKCDNCYLAITDTHLHYIGFADEKCIENQSFPFSEIKEFKSGKGNLKDHYLNKGYAGSEKLSVSIDGKKHTFLYYPNINYLPNQERPNKEDYANMYVLFSEPFVKKTSALAMK